MLDDIADEFRAGHDEFDAMSTRNKALTLNRWLRSRNLVGMENPATDFRQLRNCFLGQALRHEPHESLPIISSAIYSSVACRLGLDAHSCPFPAHVITLVNPPPGESLDGNPLPTPSTPPENHLSALHENGMHLEPFSSDDEVPRSALQPVLSNYGLQNNTDTYLSPANPGSLIMRLAGNIRADRKSVV